MYAAIPSLATISPHPSFAHCIVNFPYAFKCCLCSWNFPVIDNHYFHTWHQTFLWCRWVQCWREEYLFRWEPCKVGIWGQFQCLWVSPGSVNSLNVQMLESQASPLLIGFKVKDYITLVHSLSKLVLIHQVMPFKEAPASKEFSSNSYNRKSCWRKVEFNHGAMIHNSEL